MSTTNTQNSLISKPIPRRGKARSLRHFWLAFRHAMRWSQLKQRFHYRNIGAFIKRNWFAPTVMILLAIIAYRQIPPFFESWTNSNRPQTASATVDVERTSNEPQKADFAPEFASKEKEEEQIQESAPVELPAELPSINSRSQNNEMGNKLQQQYIQRFTKVAKDENKKYRIPASVILGLAILCSEFGTTDWAQQYNNHFSIRCENNMFDNDTQLITKKGDCYVKYPTAWASFRSNSMLLSSGKFKELGRIAKEDITAWASGLERIGYPHPNFTADALLYIIETYNLQRYDE